jgi:hypothetical protein
MIRVLFIHQNLPGQFRRSMRYLQTRPDYQVVAIGEETGVRREPVGPALRVIGYARPRIRNSVLMQPVLTYVARRHEIASIGFEGRATVLRRYDFDTVGLPVYPDLLKPLATTTAAPAYAEEVA